MRGRRDQPGEERSPAPGPKPWEEAEGGSFGSWLRQQREIRNISLREIADNTKIGMRYLEALEDDRFEVLPAPIFARGFLREYAKYVGLDADEVVNFYIAADQRRQAELDETEPAAPRPQVRPPAARALPVQLSFPIPAVLGAAVALLLVVLLVIWAVRRGRTAGEGQPPPPIAAPIAEPVPVPAVETPSRASAANANELLVNLTFTAECWVEAVVDGRPGVSELKVQGESMQIRAREAVVLTLGNAGAVSAEVNGRPVRLGAAPGQVVRDLVIDRAMAGLPPLPAAAGEGRGRPR